LVASLSKSVTAVAVMRLVEAGLVDLDDPVTRYLPELAPSGDEVTVRDLMVQRSGLSTFTGRASFSGVSGSSLEANVARLGGQLEPGAGFKNSSANHNALALLVERASGRSFEDVLEGEVFGPLGMQTATTDPDLARGQGLVVGYYHWLGVGYRPHAPPLPDGMVGGYRMFASASDVSRLLVLHLNNGQVDGEQVLTPDSLTRL
jgi:CubicO group peptidase (beta-lactamase class C family)